MEINCGCFDMREKGREGVSYHIKAYLCNPLLKIHSPI